MPRKTETIEEKLSYREKMTVTEYVAIFDDAFPICPRCDTSMEIEYQGYCGSCGQALRWKGYYKAKERKRAPIK